MARLIVRIHSHPSRGGKKSELARYLAEKSAPLRETEGAKARPLFNDAEENLTCRRAESSLTNGGAPLDKTDVKHFVVSLKRKEYELLGASRRERDAALIRIARQVMQLVAAETQTTRLKWYGAIHHNRPHHPHFHIGLSKHALDAHGRAPRRLEHLPKTLLPHHVRDAGGAGCAADQRQIQLGVPKPSTPTPTPTPSPTPPDPPPGGCAWSDSQLIGVDASGDQVYLLAGGTLLVTADGSAAGSVNYFQASGIPFTASYGDRNILQSDSLRYDVEVFFPDGSHQLIASGVFKDFFPVTFSYPPGTFPRGTLPTVRITLEQPFGVALLSNKCGGGPSP